MFCYLKSIDVTASAGRRLKTGRLLELIEDKTKAILREKEIKNWKSRIKILGNFEARLLRPD
jgi:predicted GIY-YIG superfamily endonuclease